MFCIFNEQTNKILSKWALPRQPRLGEGGVFEVQLCATRIEIIMLTYVRLGARGSFFMWFCICWSKGVPVQPYGVLLVSHWARGGDFGEMLRQIWGNFRSMLLAMVL